MALEAGEQLLELPVERLEVSHREGRTARGSPAARAEFDDPLARERVADVLDRAQDGAPQGMVAERRLVDQMLGDHGRLIVCPRDLLHDDPALAVELLGVDSRATHEVGQQVGSRWGLLGAGGDVERHKIMAGVRVQDGPDPLGGFVDVPIGAVFLAPLEDEVLEKMGHPVLLGPLGPGAGVEGDQERHRAGPRDGDPVQRQPVFQRCAVDLSHAMQTVASACKSPCRGVSGRRVTGEVASVPPTHGCLKTRATGPAPRCRRTCDRASGAFADSERAARDRVPRRIEALRAR